MPLNPTVRTMTRININLPSHVVRQLFFALRCVGGMRHGPSVTMDSAAASSSALGLVFAAAPSMGVDVAASLLLLLAVYDRMLVVGAAGV